MKTETMNWRGPAGWLAFVAGLLAVASFTACESGAGGGGGSTVTGNVSSFSGGAASYIPPAMEHGALARALIGIGDLLVPSAEAAVGGVVVRVAGTGISTSTDDNGGFLLDGVPSGDRELEFEFGGSTGRLPLSVPENATVRLHNVVIRADGSSSVGHIEIDMEMEAEDDHQGGDDSGGDGHGGSSGTDDSGTSHSGSDGSGSGSGGGGTDDGPGHT